MEQDLLFISHNDNEPELEGVYFYLQGFFYHSWLAGLRDYNDDNFNYFT